METLDEKVEWTRIPWWFCEFSQICSTASLAPNILFLFCWRIAICQMYNGSLYLNFIQLWVKIKGRFGRSTHITNADTFLA